MYDTLVIELQKDEKSIGSISILKRDLDTLMNSHGQTLQEIVADMVNTLQDGIGKTEK
jgi:hypothetical protein